MGAGQRRPAALPVEGPPAGGSGLRGCFVGSCVDWCPCRARHLVSLPVVPMNEYHRPAPKAIGSQFGWKYGCFVLKCAQCKEEREAGRVPFEKPECAGALFTSRGLLAHTGKCAAVDPRPYSGMHSNLNSMNPRCGNLKHLKSWGTPSLATSCR